MKNDKPPRLHDQEFRSLEHRVEELIDLCLRLHEENAALKRQHTEMLVERAQLVEKNAAAKQRVESILLRLKGMESAHEQ